MRKWIALVAVAGLAIAGCSTGTKVTINSRGTFGPSSAPSAQVVKDWGAKWCQAQPGMAKSALVALLGPPTSSFLDQGSWDGYEWQFNAFYDANGDVRHLDINNRELSPAEKEGPACATTRVAGG